MASQHRISGNRPLVPGSSGQDSTGLEQANSVPASANTTTSRSALENTRLRAVEQDAFETGAVGRSSPTPHLREAAPPQTATPLGLLASNQAELVMLQNQLGSTIHTAGAVFPSDVKQGVCSALETSSQRVFGALERGDVSFEEAAAAMEMMREMVEMLHDLRTHNVSVVDHEVHDGGGVNVWNVRDAEGDQFVISTRKFGEASGEARIGIRQVLDDDVKLKGRHRMSMRLDLEQWGTASVDVQFGSSGLNKRIHGLAKNEDGSVFHTESGKALPDHHFRDELPDSIREPGAFAKLVQSFVEGTMTPLHTQPEHP